MCVKCALQFERVGCTWLDWFRWWELNDYGSRAGLHAVVYERGLGVPNLLRDRSQNVLSTVNSIRAIRI